MPPQQVKQGAQKQKKTVIRAETSPQHLASEGGAAPSLLTVTLTHLLMLPQVEGASAAGGALSAEAEDSGASRGKPPAASFGGHGSAFRPAVARPALPAPAAWQSTSAAADGSQQAAHAQQDTGPSEQDAYTAAGAAEGEGTLIFGQKRSSPVVSMVAF